jgi:hypothetical protein
MAIKRIVLLVSVAFVAAAPLVIGKHYAAQQLACFESLARAHAPRATFNQRFDFAYQYTYPSGATLYSYHLAHRISGVVIVRQGLVENFGMDVPDYAIPMEDTLGLYRNTWELLRHPRRLACG